MLAARLDFDTTLLHRCQQPPMFSASSAPLRRYAVLFSCAFLFATTVNAQTLWRRSGERLSDSVPSAGHYAVYELDLPQFQFALREAPAEGARNASEARLLLPSPTGELVDFLL